MIAVVVASVASIQLAGAAGGGGSTFPRTDGGVRANVVSGNLKLKSTLAAYGRSGATATAGFTDVHAPITFKCVTRTTCTFTDEGTVQIGNNGSKWALCFAVDAGGPDFCPFIGILPNDGFETTESISATMSGLAPGSHTISTQVGLLTGSTTIRLYDLKYRSYNP